jgi:hypothetical protein
VGESSGSTPDHPPLYAFNVALPAWRERIERDVGIPSLLQGLISDYELQFYLGEAGTGAPIHFHGHAVNSLAHGEKVRLDLSQYNMGCSLICFVWLSPCNDVFGSGGLCSHQTGHSTAPPPPWSSLPPTHEPLAHHPRYFNTHKKSMLKAAMVVELVQSKRRRLCCALRGPAT